ncbi:DUF4169 family protein [Pseudenhygromyxa sp. WMMC2535]|uniref:DUF4169 family protein n=1 Tax=Pseudenhygromyxa sp. WMMC2535 TaxID=2712867 RepID=UPI00155813C5|nr:DUF4169 family protein [Pseudenhygromyxa sp. WMMC2535]NVB41230.1 DUF4169 family protein [Pseudenhygromyxa sp. WMMC2535]
MAEVLNLNRFRKRKLRAEERAQAERNRVVHGRTKSEKQAARAERERTTRALDGHRREAAADDEQDPEPTQDEREGQGEA